MGDQAKISLKGVVKRIFPTQTVSDKFKKRELWLEEQGEHAQTFCLEFHQNACDAPDNFAPGDMVECHINLRGRHWSKNEKEGVMNTLQCWKMTGQGGASIQKPRPATGQNEVPAHNDSDDLPF